MDAFPRLSGQQQVATAGQYLTKEARRWWMEASQRRPAMTTWDTFANELRKRFRPSNTSAVFRDKIAMHEQRNNTVERYATRFEELAREIDDYTEAEKIAQFIRGLKADHRLHVETVRRSHNHSPTLTQSLRPTNMRKSRLTPIVDLVRSNLPTGKLLVIMRPKFSLDQPDGS